jgi:hypothetical protein
MSKTKSTWEILSKINVNDKVEKKNGLSYLSWAWAWGIVKEHYPNATYRVYENEYGLNYHHDGMTGWVKTGVRIDDIEHIEYLPIMDYRNKSIPCESITSFHVNSSIQRSLTKAIARHGLGLYIYAGEDLPQSSEPTEQVKEKAAVRKTKPQLKVGTPNWKKVVEYITNEYEKGTATELLISQVRTKYILPKETLQEINNILK